MLFRCLIKVIKVSGSDIWSLNAAVLTDAGGREDFKGRLGWLRTS